MTFRGHFKNGVVVFDEPPPLVDGAAVDVAPAGERAGRPVNAKRFEEHDVVRVRRDVEVEGHRLRKGMVGAVVSVYGDGQAFAVEFTDLPGGTDVVTLVADQLEPAGSAHG